MKMQKACIKQVIKQVGKKIKLINKNEKKKKHIK